MGIVEDKDESNLKTINITVNGEDRRVKVKPNELLLNVIREDLGFTGAKYGCGTGECGACTILLDGKPVLSCLTLAVTADGKDIITIEGIADETLDKIQQAFLDEGAIQCGYCTPGMILMAKDLLDDNPNPSEEDIREQIKGNLCRCTGYTNIVEAIKSCAKENY